VPEDAFDLSPAGIMLYGAFKERPLQAYARLNVPVVLVDRPPGKHRLHAVTADNIRAAADAVERLMGLGHRRIAFIQYALDGLKERDPDSRERRLGYQRALKAAGLFDRHLALTSVEGDLGYATEKLRDLMRSQPPVTAVLAVDSKRARLAFEAAKGLGLRIPQDISVVSFEGAEASRPDLTGPITDFFEMGRRAAELLRTPKSPARHERIPPTWNEGKTVAAPSRR
jgi:DNA-binding LacI/PurR family transcriptional regulator